MEGHACFQVFARSLSCVYVRGQNKKQPSFSDASRTTTPHPRGGGVPRRIANSQCIPAETTKYRVRGRHELRRHARRDRHARAGAHVHTASSTGEERRKRDHPIAPDRLHRFLHSLCPQASHSLTSAKIAAIDEDTPPSRALRCKDADEDTRRAKSSGPSSGRGSGTSSRRRPT